MGCSVRGVSEAWALLTITSDGPVGTYVLSGEIDMSNARTIKELALPLGVSIVTLDLGEVRFVDSAGIAALCVLAERLKGGSLVLKRPTEAVQRVLSLAGMDMVPGVLIEP